MLVPQGGIKAGPRSYSKHDPANPYRSELDYAGKTGQQRASESALPVVNRNGNGLFEPRGLYQAPVIIIQGRELGATQVVVRGSSV